MSTIVSNSPSISFKDGQAIIEKQFSSLLPESCIREHLRNRRYSIIELRCEGFDFEVVLTKTINTDETSLSIEDQLIRDFSEMDEFGQE